MVIYLKISWFNDSLNFSSSLGGGVQPDIKVDNVQFPHTNIAAAHHIIMEKLIIMFYYYIIYMPTTVGNHKY